MPPRLNLSGIGQVSCQTTSIYGAAMTTSTQSLIDLLTGWVVARSTEDAAAWFRGEIKRLGASPTEKDVYLALGYATRKLGKADLDLSPEERARAAAARSGWDPSDWSIDQAGRIALVLASSRSDAHAFRKRLEQLFNTADIGELIAFYRGLPLYPEPSLHLPRAREGTRSAMQPIFEAVAHRNPYPKENFDENAWNQMVLKALFVGSRLAPIQGLDERANPPLMRMLCDYARERRAAGRPVAPELWRCVGPFADASAIADLAALLTSPDVTERRAAALALSASRTDAASSALSSHEGLLQDVKTGRLTWSSLDAK